MKEDNIVVIRKFDNAIDANIAKTKLDAYGVPCFLTEENLSNLYPGQPLDFFKVRLHLFAADHEKALQILNETELTTDSENIVVCPSCNSTRIERTFPKKESESLITIFFGVFLPKRKINHCLQCDHEF